MELGGHTVLVTGGTSGVGLAFAPAVDTEPGIDRRGDKKDRTAARWRNSCGSDGSDPQRCVGGADRRAIHLREKREAIFQEMNARF